MGIEDVVKAILYRTMEGGRTNHCRDLAIG